MISKSLFLDAETIGQSVFKSPIINWSYIVVDWNRFITNPYTFEELLDEMQFTKFKLQQQMVDGCVYSKRDLQFWLDQPNGVDVLKPIEGEVHVSTGLEQLLNYVTEQGKISRWWTRANCFDPIFLQRIAETNGFSMDEINKIIPYWLVRDTRTYIDTRFNFKNKKNAFCPYDDEKLWASKFELHNSRHDVAADILRLQRIEQIISE